MSNPVAKLSPHTNEWADLIKDQLARVGFNENRPVPFFECNVPGEKLDPRKPKPPLLIPVTKPTEQFNLEHGPYGRHDVRSSPESQASMAEHGIKTLIQEEGLPADNGVFHTELFQMDSHLGLITPAILVKPILEQEFSITSRFTDARDNLPSTQAKLSEMSVTIQNAGDRAGMDLSHLDPKQWAAIFRNSNALVIGSVKLPDYQINVVAGANQTRHTAFQIDPFLTIYSMASQTNTRPFMYDEYGEPPPVHLEVLER